MHHLSIGTLPRYLVNFRPGYKQAIMAATVAYLGMYGLCRVYLIYYILRIFGAQQGRSALQAFARLRVPGKARHGHNVASQFDLADYGYFTTPHSQSRARRWCTKEEMMVQNLCNLE